MDKKNKRKMRRKRKAQSEAEKQRTAELDALSREQHTVMHCQGHPVKAERSEMLQNTSESSQKSEGEGNSGASQEKLNCRVTFCSFGEYLHKALQSLDGCMIVLSTDGVILYVAENIFSVLGYLPSEVMGKKLLSFLPDEEKNEVYNLITLRLPSANAEEKHIEFCCHVKRRSNEYGESPAYNYAKFLMHIEDVFNDPFLFFCGSSYNSAESSALSLPSIPMEEWFYLVGTVCLLRPQFVWEHFFLREHHEEISLSKDLDEEEEHELDNHRNFQDEGRNTGVEVLPAEPTDVIPNIQNNSSEMEDNESYFSTNEVIMKDASESSVQPNVSPRDSSAALPVALGLECPEASCEMDQVGSRAQDALPHSSVAASSSREPSLESYIHHRELDLLQKFQEHLEERTQLLWDGMKSQQEALEVFKRQLQAMHCCHFKMHKDGAQPQASGAVSSNQPSRPDLKAEDQVRGSHAAQSITFPREPCVASIQEQQQQQEQETSHSGLSVPISNNQIQLMETQPRLVPIQLIADQEAAQHADEPCSFLPVEWQEPAMDLEPTACYPISDAIPSASLIESSLRASSDIPVLQSLQDCTQLWQEPPDQQEYVLIEVIPYLIEEDDSEEAAQPVPVVWNQMQAPEVAAQEHPSPQAFQDTAVQVPDEVPVFLPMEQPCKTEP